jgi:hypothetical protein
MRCFPVSQAEPRHLRQHDLAWRNRCGPLRRACSASGFGPPGFLDALRAELADQPNIHTCDIYPAFINTICSKEFPDDLGEKGTSELPIGLLESS